jgi:CRISPR type I-E-associated protein CasA/Cse1
MTEPAAEMRFNALTDAWIPLVQTTGETVWASPVEVLCGERDGEDLDYPRDDFRVYARLLLSALVQALLPARDSRELTERIKSPLTRSEIEARVTSVLSDFDLFGPTPFLQVIPPQDVPDKGAAPFVFGAVDLYQPAVSIDAVCVPVALVTMFVEQTYAGGAGRGYGAGPGGQPGALTLVGTDSIRSSAWANTLTLATADMKYSKEEERPWSNAKQRPRPRASIGLVGGLFFQPRSIWLIPAGEGECSFTGRRGPLVRLSPFLPKSELTAKPSSGEDVWVHPCAPMAVNSQGIAPIRLNAERPTWTGLAQLLRPLSRTKKTEHPLEGPALVLSQWKSLGIDRRRPRLLVLDFDRDKASVKRRFFEAFPLTRDLLDTSVVERLRTLLSEVEDVERALVKFLKRAHDDRRVGGLALEDARTSFWAGTEVPFWGWLSGAVNEERDSDEGAERLEKAHDATLELIRRAALEIFDKHAELSEFEPSKQARIAKARRQLRHVLWPQARVPRSTPTAEVTS